MGLYKQKNDAHTPTHDCRARRSTPHKTCMIMCPFKDTPSEVGGFMARGGAHIHYLRATVGLTYLGLAVAGRSSSLSTTSTANYYLLQALHRVAWKWRGAQSGHVVNRHPNGGARGPGLGSACIMDGASACIMAGARRRWRLHHRLGRSVGAQRCASASAGPLRHADTYRGPPRASAWAHQGLRPAGVPLAGQV